MTILDEAVTTVISNSKGTLGIESELYQPDGVILPKVLQPGEQFVHMTTQSKLE